jgi:hypothetical protein
MADTQESFDDVLDVLSASIQLYGHEEQNGHLATFLSDLALELVNQDDASVSSEKKVKMHRIRGAAYSTLASQSEEHVDRASFHETAAKSLETAVELDPNDWKSHYELGLQKAIMQAYRQPFKGDPIFRSWSSNVIFIQVRIRHNLLARYSRIFMDRRRAYLERTL